MSRALIAIALVVTVTACKQNEAKPPPPPPAAERIQPPPPAPPTPPARAEDAAAKPPEGETAAAATGKWMEAASSGKELFAVFNTSMGKFTVRLFSKDAPKTVTNFVGLATGEKEWRDPKSNQKVVGRPLYSGVVFHRVIPNFMIQGGDPLGTGTGDPGYRFEDEFQSGRTFDKPGLLAMANAGPGTNGSQFFITTAATPWLNNRHTIFGEVIEGYEVVDRIGKTPTRPGDRPVTPIVIESIQIKDKA